MHGIFMYIIDTEVEDSPMDIYCNWEEAFAHHHCGENNWYSPIALWRNGKLISSIDGNKINDKSEVQEMPVEKVLLDAMRIAAVDLRLNNAIPIDIPGMTHQNNEAIKEMSYDEILKAITHDVPAYLAEAYQKSIGQQHSDGFNSDMIKRKLTSQGYEIFMDSNLPPFAPYPESPYQWRLCDLRSKKDSEIKANAAILLIDIHT